MPELPANPAPSIRVDLVSTAVNFLSDPAVAASPLSRRLAFLEQKGLTAGEIELALARAQGQGQPAVAEAAKGKETMMQVQSRPFNWRGLVIGGGAAVATALLIHQNLDMLKVSLREWHCHCSSILLSL